MSVNAVDSEVAHAISDAAGGLPPIASFEGHEADWDQLGGNWSGERLPLEAIAENIVLDRNRVARRLGFPSQVNPGGRKQRLLDGTIPDLWCAEGVVGEVKNQITAQWGPAQLENYIDQCDAQWPEYKWRGLLVQGVPRWPQTRSTA